jgi:hypothetical protein
LAKFWLKNVRCFRETGPVPLAPITILVGENSTGKTSFLATFRALHDIFVGGRRNPFNDPPFFLGSYDEIAHYRGGRGGRAKEFDIGLRFLIGSGRQRRRDGTRECMLATKFIKRGSQPELAQITLEAGSYVVSVSFGEKTQPAAVQISTPNDNFAVDIGREDFPIIRPTTIGLGVEFVQMALFRYIYSTRSERLRDSEKNMPREDLDEIESIFFSARREFGRRPYASAPIRAKPERTYTPVDDTPDSEGTHVPLILTRTAILQKNEWQTIKNEIDKFGTNSGLFEGIEIRKLGKHESDPFQIEFKIAGPKRNIADVGYGVSQALPIVVDVLTQPKGTTFLLQQPEVHLHPRAQASLGTFVAEMSRSRGHRFIIETHSDYLTDRLRRHVRRGPLKSDDLLLLYFVRQGVEVQIHQLAVDQDGRIQRAPPGYREFFLNEELESVGLFDVADN